MPAYSWDEIPDEPVRPGVRRRAFGSDDVILVLNQCEPGMEVRPHSHEFDQLAMITKGRAIYHIGDEPNEVGPGSVMYTTPNAPHGILNTGDVPLVFYFVKWAGKESGGKAAR